MAGQQPQSLRKDELPEYPFVGPFGGIQTEVPLDKIGLSGFQDVQNVMFWKSQARSFPAFTPLAGGSPSGEIIIGIADFFNVNGTRLSVVWTPTKMYTYSSGVWTQITGAALTGSVLQFMSWDVVGYKLYFSQQADKVQMWDGLTVGFADAAVAAIPAKYLCELDFHLLAADTIEAGPAAAPNRIHWTGIGDGTDWTSFSSGQTDLFNGLGPINGLARVYQAGYAFQQFGITQIIPTGNGLAPFAFIPMGSRAKGSILTYGVASFGELIAAYIGKNDAYIFDGNESIGVGGRPIDGNRRLGARSRIFSDLFTTLESNIYSTIISEANGNNYESWWLMIPNLNKAWVYHFDEGTWTQEFFTPSRLVGPAGVLGIQVGVPRIMDLIGTIAQQNWAPATLSNSNPLDTMVISDSLANNVAALDFGTPGSAPTSGSINANDGWYIKSGQLNYDDPRHTHTTKKIRLLAIDYAAVTVSLRLTNENGESQTKNITYGTGSGKTITQIIPFDIPGKWVTWEMSGPKEVNWGMSEITLVYDVGGEVQQNR